MTLSIKHEKSSSAGQCFLWLTLKCPWANTVNSSWWDPTVPRLTRPLKRKDEFPTTRQKRKTLLVGEFLNSPIHSHTGQCKVPPCSSGAIRSCVMQCFPQKSHNKLTQTVPDSHVKQTKSQLCRILRILAQGARDSNQQPPDYLMTRSTSWATAAASQVNPFCSLTSFVRTVALHKHKSICFVHIISTFLLVISGSDVYELTLMSEGGGGVWNGKTDQQFTWNVGKSCSQNQVFFKEMAGQFSPLRLRSNHINQNMIFS